MTKRYFDGWTEILITGGTGFLESIYCSGIQILNPRRVNSLTDESETFDGVWQQLIAQRQLMVASVYPERWYAVDTVDQLLNLNRMPI